MDTARQIDVAKDQLDRVLGFFSRLDAKSSVVLAIDTGMLGFLVAHAPSFLDLQGWTIILPVVTALFITVSIGLLFFSGSPSLDGGHQSMIYFREIARRTEAKYIEEFISTSGEQYLKDILGQVWRNSEILKKKFDHLKWAMRLLIVAIIPWVVSLLLFAVHTAPLATAAVST